MKKGYGILQKVFRCFQEADRNKVQRLSDFPAYEELEPLLYNAFGKDMEEKYGIGREMTIAEFTDCFKPDRTSGDTENTLLETLQKAG